jgi:tetratricopeptide (TPR) repeat protein
MKNGHGTAEQDHEAPARGPLEEFELRYGAISAGLKRAGSAEERNVIRGEIIALFRDVDALHARAGELRERIRILIQEYKSLAQAGRPPEPRPALYSDPLNSSSFVERGWNLIAAERFPEAVEALEKALALSPGNLEAEGLLGWALIGEGRVERALSALQRVLLADPMNEMARVNLGLLCLRRRIYGEAQEHLSRALEMGRDKKASLYALLYLGLLHDERNEPDKALDYYKRAIERGPNLIEAYYRLGQLLHRQGRTDEARVVWENAIQRSRYNPYAKRSQALLEELAAGGAPVGS